MKMKIAVTAVILLLVATLVVVITTKPTSQEEKNAKERIRKYTIVRDEEKLITEILSYRYNAATIRSKMQPAPKIVPKPALPPVIVEPKVKE